MMHTSLEATGSTWPLTCAPPARLPCSTGRGSGSSSPPKTHRLANDCSSVPGSRASSPGDAKILAQLQRELQGIAESAAREEEEERHEQAASWGGGGGGGGGSGSGSRGSATPPEPQAASPAVATSAASGWGDHAWEGGWAAEEQGEEPLLLASSPSLFSDAAPESAVLAASPSPEPSPVPSLLLEPLGNGAAAGAGSGSHTRQGSAAKEVVAAAVAVAAAEAAAAAAAAEAADLQRKLRHWKAQVGGCIGVTARGFIYLVLL
jgi:hypothetical protein